jgi:hypothetical protein
MFQTKAEEKIETNLVVNNLFPKIVLFFVRKIKQSHYRS